MTRNITIEAALDEAKRDYANRHPASRAHHEAATSAMPGGNTRTVLFTDPFPVPIARGARARLWDVDGHEYIDFLAEFTAGIAGHSHPAIRRAIERALESGISLGAHNTTQSSRSSLPPCRPAFRPWHCSGSPTPAPRPIFSR
jgi:glutamate-1-semialdehyde 2,1-aminomutase